MSAPRWSRPVACSTSPWPPTTTARASPRCASDGRLGSEPRRLAVGMDEGDLTPVPRRSWFDRAQVAGLASIGAGAIHLAAAGIHAEHPAVARIFVLMGAAQLIAGFWLALSGRR